MKSRFVGVNPAKFSHYYRGGTYLKATKGTPQVREPASGEKYDVGNGSGYTPSTIPAYEFRFFTDNTPPATSVYIKWNLMDDGHGVPISGIGARVTLAPGTPNPVSVVYGPDLYFRGAAHHAADVSGSWSFGIYRIKGGGAGGGGLIQINTHVPASGRIKMSNWRSAEYGV